MAVQPTIYRVGARDERRLQSGVGQFLRHLDYLLLASTAAIVGYGLWVVRTVTRDDVRGDPGYYFTRQAVYAGLGLALLLVVAAIDPERWRRYRTVLFGAVVVLILAVLALGPSIRGSKRWFDLGFFQLQPSELGKIVLVVFLAGFLADRARHLEQFRVPLAAVGLAAIPILLVFVEPDFGTALVLTAAVVGVLVFSGTRWLHLAVFATVAVVLAVGVLWALPAAGVQVLKPYQVDRLIGFIHPDADPSGTTYNVNQSITAVGAGGLDGRGVAGATQTNQNYLPEHATDFIFASLAEQRGFLGASILLLLYALLIWRGIKIVAIAPSGFTAAVGGAIVTVFVFQVFLNIGMTTGIAPITGITLPFVSYGGSSMLTSLALVGLLQAIHVRGRLAGGR